MHIDVSGCRCTQQHIGAVFGADGGLRWSDLNRSINRLDSALHASQSAPAEWERFVAGWRRESEWSGPKLQRYSERLAQLAEAFGGARTQRAIVAGGLGIGDDVRGIDDAISGVIMSVAPMLGPYGGIITGVHNARRNIMYGADAPPAGKRGGPSAAPASIAGKVAAAQTLTRRVRRGDASAKATVDSLRSRAATDPQARKDLRIAIAARRDDSRRIEAAYQRTHGTRVAGAHADEAQDRELIARMIQQTGCQCEKGRR